LIQEANLGNEIELNYFVNHDNEYEIKKRKLKKCIFNKQPQQQLKYLLLSVNLIRFQFQKIDYSLINILIPPK
jgi:hypothetical protein